MAFSEITIFIASILVMLVGLAGIIIPILPGVPLIMGAIFVYALVDGFEVISWNILGVFGVLTAASLLIDWIAASYGVKKMGGTWLGVVGAMIGMVVGLFSGGLPGLVIGSFLGAFLAELLVGKKSKEALKAGTGSFLGFIGGGVLKFIVGSVMIGIFVWKVLF